MADSFTRVYIHDEDYKVLRDLFSNNESRPAKGVLVRRVLTRNGELENEIAVIKEVVK